MLLFLIRLTKPFNFLTKVSRGTGDDGTNLVTSIPAGEINSPLITFNCNELR